MSANWNPLTGRYDWSGMSIDQIQSAYDKARREGDSDAVRSARGALYRRGVRVERRGAEQFGDRIRQRVEAQLAAASETVVRIGIQSQDGRTPKEAIDEAAATPRGQTPTLAAIAAIHEFGTISRGGTIPERSYLRSTADQQGRSWVRALGRVIREYGRNPQRATTMLAAMLVQTRDQVQATIRAGISPDLAESTKTPRRVGRGGPVPLIYTGQLIGSIRSTADSLDGERDSGYSRGGA
jgi:hypothetical protein